MRVFHHFPFAAPLSGAAGSTFAAQAAATRHSLSVVCVRDALNALRKHLFLAFSAAGLRVSHVVISRTDGDDTATITVKLTCPRSAQAALGDVVKSLGDDARVRRVCWQRGDATASAVGGVSAHAR